MRKLMVEVVLVNTLAVLALGMTAAAWEVPSWDPRLTQPGAVDEYVDKTWCGHVQGMCVNSNALYFAFHTHILKTDWTGHYLKRHLQNPSSGTFHFASAVATL